MTSGLRSEKIGKPRRGWTRDELIVAFILYCRIPFGRIHIRNPDIISLANALERTPSSVSWKLANFARLDPALQKRHIRGASHGSRAEEEIWNEFSDDCPSSPLGVSAAYHRSPQCAVRKLLHGLGGFRRRTHDLRYHTAP